MLHDPSALTRDTWPLAQRLDLHPVFLSIVFLVFLQLTNLKRQRDHDMMVVVVVVVVSLIKYRCLDRV